MSDATNPNWDRICQVLEYSGEPSVNALARKLGLKRAENLYQIKRGKNAVSMELAKKINRIYPRFSIPWLICGDDMSLPEGSYNRNKTRKPLKLPYIDNIHAVMQELEKPEKHIHISPEISGGACFAALYQDNTMDPELKTGSVLLLRENTAEIIYGKTYMICTGSNTMFRVIRKGNVPEQVVLTSPNREIYDDLELKRSEIEGLFQVCGALTFM